MDEDGIALRAELQLRDSHGQDEASSPQPRVPRAAPRPAAASRPRRLLCISAQRQPELQAELGKSGWQVAVAPDFSAADAMLRDKAAPVGLFLTTAEDEDSWRRTGEFLMAHGDVVWVAALRSAALEQPACLDVVLGSLFDYHHLPLDLPRLLMTLGHAHGYAELRREHQRQPEDPAGLGIIGYSAATQRLLAQVRRMAQVEAPVLIQGESGSGKELAARAIHQCSARSQAPFVAVNCSAIHGSLLHWDLFGHTTGPFPAAPQDRCGRIEAADGGTVFLDEIGDLPMELQVSLLRFLQDRTIHRMGSAQGTEIDVRVIAATHVDLEQAIRAGRFRQDLYYRLSVLQLQVPALRERRGDITLLAQHFYHLYAHERRPGLRGFGRAALASLQVHDWPGNVRELDNRVRHAAVMAEGRLIRPEDLGLMGPRSSSAAEALDAARTLAERSAVCASLQRAGNNVTRAARDLGISRMTLYRLMAKHGIQG